MTGGKDVFLIGPGFIGWNILEIVVAEGYNVSALVRREEHAKGIRASGATAVMGTLDDHALITAQVSMADVVYQVATGDNQQLLQAITAGIRERSQQGKTTIYIHTSGAKVFDDGAKGMFKTDRIYSDDDPSDIDTVSDLAPHRKLDLAIIETQKELRHTLKAAIMLPPEVYGYDSKHDRLSMTIPMLTRFAIKHGFVPIVGKGLSVETQIHVLDLARGYVEVLHWLEKADEQDIVANPYWLCENGGEFSWLDLAQAVGKALHDAGKIKNPEPQTVTKQYLPDLLGEKTDSYMGLNCRARAVRLRGLGWQAIEKGIWESFLEDELPVMLKETP